ncbi:NAD-dependent epimerase/dehydratase family protein [Sinomonas soli]
MRILLTGSTGLIGAAVRSRLSTEHDVVTLGRRVSCHVRADLAEPNSFHSADFGRLDALVHCAGVIDEDFRDNPERAFRSATLGSNALVSAAIEAGARRLVYVSSAHVYGPMVSHKDESSVSDPRSDYAIAHYATEQIFKRSCSSDVSGVALRPCAVFGELSHPSDFRRWSLIPFAFPREVVESGHIAIRSSGEQRRNFVGTADIASTVMQWLKNTPQGWSVVNPIGRCTLSVYQFAQLCADVAYELTGRTTEVTRQIGQAPVVGDDFDYASRYPIAEGRQDLRQTLANLIETIGAVA